MFTHGFYCRAAHPVTDLRFAPYLFECFCINYSCLHILDGKRFKVWRFGVKLNPIHWADADTPVKSTLKQIMNEGCALCGINALVAPKLSPFQCTMTSGHSGLRPGPPLDAQHPRSAALPLTGQGIQLGIRIDITALSWCPKHRGSG